MRHMTKGTAVVIPCYNEHDRLDVDRLVQFLERDHDVSFILVDDGSTDGTLERLRVIQRSAPERVQCVALPVNGGKAEAVRQGVLQALTGGFERVGYWDADLATPLDAIQRMRTRMSDERIIMVLGSRVKLLGFDVHRRAVRHYLGRLYATGASVVLRLPVYDTQCGAKIFRNGRDLRQAFSQPFAVGWSFDVELLGRFKILREMRGESPLTRCAVEYPLERWTHVSGSKVGPTDFARGLWELGKLWALLNWPSVKRRYLARLCA